MSNNQPNVHSEGVMIYDRAAFQAFWQKLIRQLRGQPVQLLSFDDIRARLRLREGAYAGLQDIPLDRIVGSVGRYRDFTATFLPTPIVDRDRWSGVYAETIGDVGLPPIEVYRVGDGLTCIYFVRDGNHRVSVARALKFKTIQAYVTHIDTDVCLEQLLVTRDLDAAGAYVNFLNESGLADLPGHEYLFLSEPTRYNDLLGHIHLHTSVTGKPPADWHDSAYRPVVHLIRESGILQRFKGRTEADLYLWLVDHLCDLEVCYLDMTTGISPELASFLGKQGLSLPAFKK